MKYLRTIGSRLLIELKHFYYGVMFELGYCPCGGRIEDYGYKDVECSRCGTKTRVRG